MDRITLNYIVGISEGCQVWVTKSSQMLKTVLFYFLLFVCLFVCLFVFIWGSWGCALTCGLKRTTHRNSVKQWFPSGNIELRRDAMGNAISVVQLWIICVISQNSRPDVRCGDVMTRMLKSTWCAASASFFVIQQSSLCVSVDCVLWVCYYQDRK